MAYMGIIVFIFLFGEVNCWIYSQKFDFIAMGEVSHKIDFYPYTSPECKF